VKSVQSGRKSAVVWTSIVALLATLSISQAAEPAEGIRVEPARPVFEAGEAIEVVVSNESAAPIFVASCGALQGELLVDEHYEAVAPPSCVEEGAARLLAVGKSSLFLPVPPELVGQTGRVALVLGSVASETAL